MSGERAVGDGVVPGAPGDNTTMSEVLRLYAKAGFTSSWEMTADSHLRCGVCHTKMAPTSVMMRSLRRLEGASDPDDAAAILALTCSLCGARGTLVTMYGPMASRQEAEIVTQLCDQRAGDANPADAPPGETTNHDGPARPPRIGDPAPD